MTPAGQRALIVWTLAAFWIAIYLIGGLALVGFVAVCLLLFVMAIYGMEL